MTSGSLLRGVMIGGSILTLICGCRYVGILRGSDVPTVTYCDLTARPEFYDNKVVRIRAVMDNNFEQRYLYDLVCKVGEAPKTGRETPAETWVEFDPSFDNKGESEQAETNRKISGYGRFDVTAIGKFQAAHGADRFGHLGCCKYRLVIRNVEAAVLSSTR